MSQFTYENQGTETMLVYRLAPEEHLDEFSRGMLQENEITGILRPSFAQKDAERFIKYPVTSRVPLKDFVSGEMERKTVLKMCLSLVGAMKEIEEYMLGQEKLFLDPEYIFVDIRRKELSLVYLPVDEVSREQSVGEFLLGILSHMRFRVDEDVSYVVRLMNFLNQPKAWELDDLKRYLETLANGDAQRAHAAGMERAGSRELAGSGRSEEETALAAAGNSGNRYAEAAGIPGNSNAAALAAVSGRESGYGPGNISDFGGIRGGDDSVGAAGTAGAAGAVSGGLPASDIPGAEAAEGTEKKKGGLFGKKESKEKKKSGLFGKKDAGKAETGNAASAAIPGGPSIPGMAGNGAGLGGPSIPGVAGNGAGLGGPSIPGVAGNGAGLAGPSIPGTAASGAAPDKAEKKEKKGLFGRSKKKEARPLVIPQTMAAQPPLPESGIGFPAGAPAPAPQPRPAGNASGAFMGQANGNAYVGQGRSEDENRTVIMGGGEDYASTVFLGGDSPAEVWSSHVIRIIRRRTGQSVTINQKTFRIGSAGEYVDFYIPDNPAIGGWHADLSESDGAWYIMDRNSANHTCVNGVMIRPMEAVRLNNGALITLADEDFDFIIS